MNLAAFRFVRDPTQEIGSMLLDGPGEIVHSQPPHDQSASHPLRPGKGVHTIKKLRFCILDSRHVLVVATGMAKRARVGNATTRQGTRTCRNLNRDIARKGTVKINLVPAA